MSYKANDEKALNNLTNRIDAAWNNRDAKAFSDLFEEAGDFIFHNGLTLQGRAAIEKYYQGSFPQLASAITDGMEDLLSQGNHNWAVSGP